MTYSNSSMKNGDLIFRHGTSFFDVVVEDWENSPWSHCGVIQVAADGTLGVLQAVSKSGVYVIAMDGFLTQGACSWISTGVEWSDSIQGQANALIGQPYNDLADVEVGLGLAPPEGVWNCSLLCGAVMRFCGVNIPRAGLTPKALALYFTSQGKQLQPINGV